MIKREFWQGDCLELMRRIPDGSVDMVVTSPPYDNIRTYNDSLEWSFDIFKPIARELTRCIKPGGVIVWNVADATIKGSETGSSFRQALYFKDDCGLNLHDTMIWQKSKVVPKDPKCHRYWDGFEYMFVLSKGKPKTCNYITEQTIHAGKEAISINRTSDGNMRKDRVDKQIGRKVSSRKIKSNVWELSNAGRVKEHPATFPLQLPTDHILSWSNPGDVILDPFAGSGTTAIAALNTGRGYICIERDPEYYRIATERVSNHAETLKDRLL